MLVSSKRKLPDIGKELDLLDLSSAGSVIRELPHLLHGGSPGVLNDRYARGIILNPWGENIVLLSTDLGKKKKGAFIRGIAVEVKSSNEQQP